MGSLEIDIVLPTLPPEAQAVLQEAFVAAYNQGIKDLSEQLLNQPVTDKSVIRRVTEQMLQTGVVKFKESPKSKV